MEHGMKTVEVAVKGPGSGREAAIRALQATGLEVNCYSRCYASASQRFSSSKASSCLICDVHFEGKLHFVRTTARHHAF